MNKEQIEKLKALAEAAEKDVIRSHGWVGSIEMLETLRIDEEYLTAASPAAILELIALAEHSLSAQDRVPDTSQDWAKLDGAQAFHLIERHADGWEETGNMMESWLAARMGAAPVSLTDEGIIAYAAEIFDFKPHKQGEEQKAKWITFARALLAAAPAPIQQASPAPLFDRKLENLQQRGYEVIGRILHKDGEYALFDSSTRWLTQPQYWRLMHEQDGSLFATPPALAGSQVQAAGDAVVDDLAMLVRRLVRSLEKANPGTDLAPQALDYLKRKGLQGSPLRTDKPNADCSAEPANCPDNEGYGCACDPMNKAAREQQP